jgi:oxaloacetate decarboxylase gamma subunit
MVVMDEAVELVIVGMGSVFAFLAVLVGTMTLMSWIVGRLPREPQPQAAPARPKDDARLVAAVTAAIRKHRSESH